MKHFPKLLPLAFLLLSCGGGGGGGTTAPPNAFPALYTGTFLQTDTGQTGTIQLYFDLYGNETGVLSNTTTGQTASILGFYTVTDNGPQLTGTFQYPNQAAEGFSGYVYFVPGSNLKSITGGIPPVTGSSFVAMNYSANFVSATPNEALLQPNLSGEYSGSFQTSDGQSGSILVGIDRYGNLGGSFENTTIREDINFQGICTASGNNVQLTGAYQYSGQAACGFTGPLTLSNNNKTISGTLGPVPAGSSATITFSVNYTGPNAGA